MGGEIKVGDAPIQVNGTIAIHLHSPNGPATLENSHWPTEAATWNPVVECENVTGNAGVVLEIAGSLRLTGDVDAKCSICFISIGGLR